MSCLNCKGLSVVFGAVCALDHVSFSAPAGSWTYLMGPSGSGKTTLLRAIAGLTELASGRVTVDGNDITARPPHARGVAFLPQAPSLWPHLSARANVELVLHAGAKARREAALAALDRLGIAHLAARLPMQLSGGQARLVEVARAMAAGVRIMLLDEPTAHLDLHLREALMQRLQALHGEAGWTTLCVVHQPEVPLDAQARVVVCEAGRLVSDGSFSGLAAAPQTAYVQALTKAVDRILNL
jgi:ABC-type Fe3+/spermidine/putrescine transport system ATPase subunit